MYINEIHLRTNTYIEIYASFNQIQFNYEQLQLFEFKSVYMNTIRIIITLFIY